MTATQSSATVKGGMFETAGLSTLTSMQGKSSHRRFIAQLLGKKSMLKIRAKWLALTGAAAGGAASKTYGRIANSTELGGVRTIEQETISSGNTDSADETEIEADFLNLTALTSDPTPVANGDLNPLGTR